jgi:predicted esterase
MTVSWPLLVLCAVAVWACGATSVARHAPSELDERIRRVEVPTAPLERAALAQVSSLRADRVELGVAFPPSFDPSEEHPILITQVTADRFRSNLAELGAYAPTALEQGYVVLTAQGIPWPDDPDDDTLLHRYASVRAALRWLAREVPRSESWPIVLAGFSGGAKISQVLAFSLTLEQRRVAGVFLGGCNEDHSRVLLAEYPSVRHSFSRIAFFLSAGKDDRIAPLSSVRAVAEHLRGSGVQRLELSEHPGEHRLDPRDLERALRWFQTQIDRAD